LSLRRALPSIATSGNLVAGFLALLMVAQSNFLQAAVLVVIAAGFDLIDGAIARHHSTAGDFGCNLDSLADLVSFGAVPAFALYLSTLYALPVVGLVACVGFLLCGALRLARFPLVKSSNHFVGLPIPPAGLAVVGMAFLGLPVLPAAAIALALGVLMISTVPFPTTSPSRLARRLARRLDKYPSRESDPAEQHNQ
jgi:CDP-diacylglycerol--serine O-phosphatidyltransferase